MNDKMMTIKIPREYLSGWDTKEAEEYIEGYLLAMCFADEENNNLKISTENEGD